jgi:hypothetical protein
MAQSSGGCGVAAALAEERHGDTSYGVVAVVRPRAARVRCVNGAAAVREDGGGTEEMRRRGRTTVRRWHGGEQRRGGERRGGGAEERRIGKKI